MKFFKVSTISRNLALLVIFSVLPALAILFYTGMEQRRISIESAQKDVLLLTHAMAEAQENATQSFRQVLSTLSLLPEIQNMEPGACDAIFKAVLEKNPDFLNIALTDLNGDVIASGMNSNETSINLADRKHFRNAIRTKNFAVGEYIVTRVESDRHPAFAFAYPVLDNMGNPKAVLTSTVRLGRFAYYYDISTLPEKSFVSVTDSRGIRLFYYPPSYNTNPIGKPINPKGWEIAQNAKRPGTFHSYGSDGIRRIFAFEQVRLPSGGPPYIYVWAGIPEAHILGPANEVMKRNLLLMLIATALALFIAWVIGKITLISPIQNLVSMTRGLAEGKLDSRNTLAGQTGEFGMLTRAFHDMANSLKSNQLILRENEARFRLLLDSLDAFVYAADMETYEILFVNEYGKKIFGDITGKICWQSIQTGQSGPCPFCSNKYLLNKQGQIGEVYTWEFQNTITGRWFYIKDRAIKWDDDRIVRLEIATDITERKKTEENLAKETERLAVTLRSIGDGVITTDNDGHVTLMNQVAEILTGWRTEDALGRPLGQVFKLIDRKTRQSCDNPMVQVFSSGNITGLITNTVLVTKDGLERNIADSGAPIRDRDGKITGVVLVFRDITEQLRTELELVKIKKLESIGILAGGIAHDFNNILTAVLGNIELSLLDPDLSPKTKSLLQEAAKASRRSQDLTLQLLTFAKGGEPIKETASLADVVKDSAEFILSGDKVACRYFFADDLWLVDIDKGQISQVVQNIILNAKEATEGSGTIEITCENIDHEQSDKLALPKTGNYVKMSIRDNGAGIPVDILDNIFDPYFSTKAKGTGLGLAITHSIVSKHGGHITVDSVANVGTTFTVYLPASEQSIVPSPAEEKHNSHVGKLRFMIMDDEELVRNIFKTMLEQLGHEVVLTKDGLEAIRLYQEAMAANEAIDCVIMDLTIPGGMGGKEAVRELLAIDPGAKVIVSSGYSNDPVMSNFEEYGFCSAIKKPFQLTDLFTLIDRLTK